MNRNRRRTVEDLSESTARLVRRSFGESHIKCNAECDNAKILEAAICQMSYSTNKCPKRVPSLKYKKLLCISKGSFTESTSNGFTAFGLLE